MPIRSHVLCILDALADELPGLEPVPGLRGVDAHTLCIPVLDGTEDPNGSLLHGLGHGSIGARHLQQRLVRGDRAIVGLGLALRCPVRESRLFSRMIRRTERVNDFETESALNLRSDPRAAERWRGHGQVFDLTTAPWKTLRVSHTSQQPEGVIMRQFPFSVG
jgi:hypothetical protein